MFQVDVTMMDQRVVTFPADSVPSYEDVTARLVQDRIRGQVQGVEVRNIFNSSKRFRLVGDEIVAVDNYLVAFGLSK